MCIAEGLRTHKERKGCRPSRYASQVWYVHIKLLNSRSTVSNMGIYLKQSVKCIFYMKYCMYWFQVLKTGRQEQHQRETPSLIGDIHIKQRILLDSLHKALSELDANVQPEVFDIVTVYCVINNRYNSAPMWCNITSRDVYLCKTTVFSVKLQWFDRVHYFFV